MSRKPREHGWTTSNGITHHIDTRRVNAYHSYIRTASCSLDLREAVRAPFDRVDCMACIAKVAQQQRLPPRPEPGLYVPSWRVKGPDRHKRSPIDPWKTACGVSLRPRAYGCRDEPNCETCLGNPAKKAPRRRERGKHGRLSKPR